MPGFCSPSHILILTQVWIKSSRYARECFIVGPDFIFENIASNSLTANALQKPIDTKVSCYTAFNQANVFT